MSLLICLTGTSSRYFLEHRLCDSTEVLLRGNCIIASTLDSHVGNENQRGAML